MPHPFQWRRNPEKVSTKLIRTAERKFPGNKTGKFVAFDGSIVRKNSAGSVTIQTSRNRSPKILKK